MAILVTGGCGFIGSHLVNNLVEGGHDVVVIDDLSTGDKHRLNSKATFIQGNCGDEALLQTVFAQYQPQSLIHLAASIDVGESMENPQKYYQNNVAVSKRLWKQAIMHGVKHIIFASSCAVYGSRNPIAQEDMPLSPESPYGESKKKAEQILRELAIKNVGIQYAILRLFNVGGGVRQIVHACIEAGLKQQSTVKLNGNTYATPDGTCVRDYVHVDDVVEAIGKTLIHLQNKRESLVLNIGSGQGTSVLEIVEQVGKVLGVRVPYEILPPRLGDAESIRATITRAQQVINWHPRHSVEEIIEHGYGWYINKEVV